MSKIANGKSKFHPDLFPNASSQQIQTRDRIGWTIGVLFTAIFAFIAGHNPCYIVPTFLAGFAVLYPLRLYHYYLRDWHLYCIDFCYVNLANLALFYLFDSDNPIKFIMIFGQIPLTSFAVVRHNNSLVFQSLDKFTTIYLHFGSYIASMSMYLTGNECYGGVNYDYGLYDFVYYCGSVVLAWHTIYYFVIIASGLWKNHHTNFGNTVKAGHLKPFYKGSNEFVLGIVFYVTWYTFFIPFMLAGFVLYKVKVLAIAYGVWIGVAGVWQGSRYYFEYMSDKYVRFLETFDINRKVN